jgi:hypothetical protein
MESFWCAFSSLIHISVTFQASLLEDFPSSEIPNVEGLIPNFKPCLVVKINVIQVPTTKMVWNLDLEESNLKIQPHRKSSTPHRKSATHSAFLIWKSFGGLPVAI